MPTQEMAHDSPIWLSPSEAARVLGCSQGWIRRLVDSGELISMRSPLGRLIDAKSAYAVQSDRMRNPRRRGRPPTALLTRPEPLPAA